jgi:hypothetical protein
MLTSQDRKDFIMRMIKQIMQMIAAMMGKKLDGDLDGALQLARTAQGKLLGPLADIAPRLDSVTAAHMVADPDILALWAEVVAEESDVHRRLGDEPAACAAEKRALELAVEAHLRTTVDRPELLALIARLRPAVDEPALDPRHRDALAEIRTVVPPVVEAEET